MYLREEAKVYTLSMTVLTLGWFRDIRPSSVGQIFNSLSQRLSTVEHLSLEHKASIEEDDVAQFDVIEWRKLLGSFKYVKTLSVDDPLVEEVSRCLGLDDEEHPLELLPVLQEFTYPGNYDTGDALTWFVNARQNTGRFIALNALSLRSNPGFSESSDAMTESGDAWSSDAWNEKWNDEAWNGDAWNEAWSNLDT
ncbi:hypothetical protein DFH94DRAFT_763772 [Russula ochroleuca]|uniref:Uncharacterized protein n=1 Tax=Russula ochroleuca TaxID=152965 RepID=A0A9P5JZD4_9AGAM|nr:hypothetical protein DFH94DRAFT_763772 [Russula ochroleuca]